MGMMAVKSPTLYSIGISFDVEAIIPPNIVTEINIWGQNPLKIFGSCLKKLLFSTDLEVVDQLKISAMITDHYRCPEEGGGFEMRNIMTYFISIPSGWAINAVAMGSDRPEKKTVKNQAVKTLAEIH